jgi:uncharacterized protein (DUF2336 family)
VVGLFQRLFKGGAKDEPPSYEAAKKMARHEKLDVRRDLAVRADIKPEILYFLAEDPAPEVRRLVAANKATPVQADLLLATDADDEVRCDLTEKIAKLAPGLSADEQDKIRQMTYEALEALARDQVTRVRQILSETLKDVAAAPPELINRLARDVELVVSGPVLQFSPVLSDKDLLEIIDANPSAGPLEAISKRESITEPVTDAIIATESTEAIASLLANASAQIREETLDRIIDRAPDVESWHEPLVFRPVLPAGAAAKLARFVAHNLLQALDERQDLDPEALEEVRRVVERRLEEEPSENMEARISTTEEAMKMVNELKAAGKLDEPVIAEAVKSGDREFSMAALAALAGLKVEVIRSVVSNRSAKGMLAVAWKAGLSANALEWQLDFIKDLA